MSRLGKGERNSAKPKARKAERAGASESILLGFKLCPQTHIATGCIFLEIYRKPMNPLAPLIRFQRISSLKRIFGLIALGLLLPGAGFAKIVSYTFSANVSSTWGTSFYGINPGIGEVMTGFFSYDTTASNLLVSSVEKKYFQSTPLTFGFTLRGLTLQSDGAFTIDVSNQTMSGGKIVHAIQMWDNDHQIKLNGALTSTVGFDLDFTIQNPGLNLDLPENLTSLGTISFKHGSVTAPNASGITYDLTTIAVVPEPAAGALFFAGLTLLGFKRRASTQTK